MKTKLFTLLICIFLSSIASARVSVTQIRGLSFPSIVPDINGGTIEIYGGSRNITGNATFQQVGLEARVDTEGGEREIRQLNGSMTGPGGTITIHSFKPPNLGLIFLTGPHTHIIGAQATYPAGIAPGTYTGTFAFEMNITGTWGFTNYIDASITILETPISLNQTNILNFGQIIPDPAGATISILAKTGGIFNTTGNSILEGTPTRGTINIHGVPNAAVHVSFSTGTLEGPGEDVILNNMMTYPPDGTVTLSSTGEANINVGGRINVQADQTAGIYSGTYNITVNY